MARKRNVTPNCELPIARGTWLACPTVTRYLYDYCRGAVRPVCGSSSLNSVLRTAVSLVSPVSREGGVRDGARALPRIMGFRSSLGCVRFLIAALLASRNCATRQSYDEVGDQQRLPPHGMGLPRKVRSGGSRYAAT